MPNNIDIVNDRNEPIGKTTSIDDALLHGWWHRGVHVIIYTKTSYVLVQKRSKHMQMHGGLIDFSAGGYVDTNESPEEAAIREVAEEVGLQISVADLKFELITPERRNWPKLHKHSRAFIYVYTVCLPNHNIDMSHVQLSEVEWARFIPLRTLKWLVYHHRIKNLGRIEPTYRYYKKLLPYIKSSSPAKH